MVGSVLRFAWRWWWRSGLLNQLAFLIGATGAAMSALLLPVGTAAVAVAALGPVGLGARGRSSKLSWTPRLRRLLLICLMISAPFLAVPAFWGWHAAASASALWAMSVPFFAEAGLAVARPIEGRMLEPFLRRARERLHAVSPRVVAITGSYGKTTTKGYVAHLAAGAFSVVPTPASFNNSAGLARAVNEHLAGGTQVFVAEMGTYGPGEIAAMCHWARPQVAMITAIGPVHLERMHSLERIAEAKAEILEGAQVAILNVDSPLLGELAQKVDDEGEKDLWRCSSAEPRADVRATVEEGRLHVVAKHVRAEMDVLVPALPGVEPGNVACAVAAALALEVPPDVVAARLPTLPGAPHRRSIQRNSRGATVIDDTYNANPAGAQSALALLASLGNPLGKKVVVTPGMVELGPDQARENAAFAARAGEVASLMLIIGRTNARALAAGAGAAGLPTHRARSREAAVAWVAAHLGGEDAVLYENDLPDHYP